MKWGSRFITTLLSTTKRRKIVFGLLTVVLVGVSAPPPLLALIPVLSDHAESITKEE